MRFGPDRSRGGGFPAFRCGYIKRILRGDCRYGRSLSRRCPGRLAGAGIGAILPQVRKLYRPKAEIGPLAPLACFWDAARLRARHLGITEEKKQNGGYVPQSHSRCWASYSLPASLRRASSMMLCTPIRKPPRRKQPQRLPHNRMLLVSPMEAAPGNLTRIQLSINAPVSCRPGIPRRRSRDGPNRTRGRNSATGPRRRPGIILPESSSHKPASDSSIASWACASPHADEQFFREPLNDFV